MPKYVEIGKGSTHRVEFQVDGELVIPTSASYSLLDNSSTVVEGLSDEVITLGPSDTSAIITIPSTANEVSAVTEVRYLVVNFVHEGMTYTVENYYLLRESIRFPLTTEDVKSVLGASGVADEYIDILGAYDQVALEASTVNVDNILTTGGALLPYLIEAVKYKAAILSSGILETSLMQSEQSDNTLYKRFSKVDFNSLRDGLTTQYNLALARLAGTTSDAGGLVIQLYATIAQGTDPVTGQ